MDRPPAVTGTTDRRGQRFNFLQRRGGADLKAARGRHRALDATFHLTGGTAPIAGTYSAQQESFAGSLNLEIATIFNASAIAGNTWSRSMKSGMVARYFMAIAAS